MNTKTYQLLEDYMLSCMEDSAHDKEHIYRVLYTAAEIAQTEKDVDYDILITSCLLHDIGRSEQFKDHSLSHALVGGDKAYAFLIGHGLHGSICRKGQRVYSGAQLSERNPTPKRGGKNSF